MIGRIHMAIYYTSPAERRAQAEARIQSREYNRQYEEYQAQLKAEEEAQEIAARKRAEEDAFTRTWQTLGDGLSDIAYGFFGFGEGLVDLVSGGVGAIGGIFDSGFQDDVKEFIANDWGAQFIRDPADELFQASFIHDDKTGIAEGVLNGVGQMLPMVIITAATLGAGAAPSAAAAGGSAAGTAAAGATSAASAAQAAAAAAKTAEVLNLSLLGASAAGKGAEEAYNDGAGYYQGLGYGAASGLIEVGTEKLTGGVGAMKNMFGNGVLDGVKRSVADVGLKKFAKEAVGEGLEEVVSDALNPFAKTIYKGTDAIKDAYGSFDRIVETGKGALKSFTVGTLTSAAVGNLSNAAIKKTGADVEVGRGADVEASLSSIQDNYKEMTRIDSRGTLTAEKEIKFQDNIEKNYRQVEDALQKTNEKNRARLIEKFGLSEMFDETTGKMTDAFSEQLSVQRSLIGNEPLYGNMSLNMRDRISGIESDVAQIEELWNKPTDGNPSGNQDRFVFTDTPLSQNGQEHFNDLKKFVYEKLKGNVGLVVLDTTTADFHAAKSTDGSAIYVSRADVESEAGIDGIKSMIHETYHITEGTDSSVSLFTEMKQDPALYESARDEIVQNGYATAEDVDAYLSARESGNNGAVEGLSDETVSLIESELGAAMAEKTFGNEEFFKKAIRDNVTLAQKILNHISDRSEYFSHSSSKESRAEYRRYLKMEKLYIKAAEEAGYRYENGRLIGRSGETDDGDDVLDKSGEVRYSKSSENDDLYTASDDFYREVPYSDRSSFSRKLSNKTRGIKNGEVRVVHIVTGSGVYFFAADGYMHGRILEKATDSDSFNQLEEKYNESISGTFDSWLEDFGVGERRRNWNNGFTQYAGKSERIVSLDDSNVSTKQRTVDDAESYLQSLADRGIDRLTYESDEEADLIIDKLRESLYVDREINTGENDPEIQSKLLEIFGEDDSSIKSSKTSSTTENDRTYLEAVKNGDMETAERMVREAAEKAGYTSDSSWRMQHKAPNSQEDVSLADLKESGLVPIDFWEHPEWYIYSSEERESYYKVKNAIEMLERRKAEGKHPDARIWVYRAVDKTVNTKEDYFRNGDWVTPSYDYAVNEGRNNPNGYRIIKHSVSIKNLYWDGNSIAELGFDDGSNYAYKDTLNNRKLLDVVTYDDDGNVIPLSKRFNKKNSDIRFRKTSSAEGTYRKITADMTEEERYEALKDRKLTLTAKTDSEKLRLAKEKLSATGVSLSQVSYSEKRKLLKKLGEEFGVYKPYENADVELDFSFSRENLKESVNKQKKSFENFAKMLSCFDDVIENAVGIEVHNRNGEKYKVDSSLKNVYVLVSAFEDGENIVPVKLEVKEFNDKNNSLYVAIALESIKKDGVVVQEVVSNDVAQQVTRPSTISIPDLFRKINPSDESFLKYVPKKFLEDGVRFRKTNGDTTERNEVEIRRVTEETPKRSVSEFVSDKKQEYLSSHVKTQILMTNAQAGIESLSKHFGGDVRKVKNLIQVARSAPQAAIYMITGQQMDFARDKVVGKSLSDIFIPIYKKGDAYTKDFYTYVLAIDHVDRIRLKDRAVTERANLEKSVKEIHDIVTTEGITEEEITAELSKLLRSESIGQDVKNKIREYRSWEGIDNKPVLGDMTEQEALERIRELRTAHPEFVEKAKEVWKYNDNLIQFRLDSGLIDDFCASLLRKRYPHYVPTFRDVEGLEFKGASKSGASAGRNTITVSNALKTAKGSDLPILDIQLMMSKQTSAVMRAASINSLMGEMYDQSVAYAEQGNANVMELLEEDAVDVSEDTDYSSDEYKFARNTLYFYKDGKRLSLKVPETVFQGFESLQGGMKLSDSKVVNAVRKWNDVFKKLTTQWSPFFLVRNWFKDVQEALFYTKSNPGKFFANLPRTLRMILKNDILWQKYQAMGGHQSSLFYFNEETGIYDARNKVKRGASRLLNKIGQANELIEQWTRFNEFVLSVESGVGYDQALLDSADVTTNFSRSGTLTRKMNATIAPFLNPAVQGWSKLWQTVTGRKSAKEWASLVLRAVILGIMPSLLNGLLYDDDDEYQALNTRDKENYYIFKAGDVFVKIPKGRVEAAIGSGVVRAFAAKNGDENAFNPLEWGQSVLDMVSPVENFSRNLFSPFSDMATNRTWYGTAIESQKFDNVEPKDRYDESTSSLAIALGKVFNYSPKKIHYLIDQYTGIIGDIVLPLTTNKAERGIIESNFTIDPVLSNRYSDDFYDELETSNYAKTSGDVIASLKVRYMNSVSKSISDMYQQKRDIANSDLSNGEKVKQTRIVQALINETLKSAIDTADQVEQYLIDIHYENTYLKLTESKAFTSADEKTQEKAITLFQNAYYDLMRYNLFGDEEGEKNALFLQAIDADTLSMAVAVARQFESDYDRNGNVVSGSRKKKIEAYVQSLRLSAAEKYMIMGYLGYKNKNGKQVVRTYIQRLKLKKEQKQKLFAYCGYGE